MGLLGTTSRSRKPKVVGISVTTFLKMPEKKKFERLPKTVVPSNYDLFLEPDLEKFTFNGSEDISVQVFFSSLN